ENRSPDPDNRGNCHAEYRTGEDIPEDDAPDLDRKRDETLIGLLPLLPRGDQGAGGGRGEEEHHAKETREEECYVEVPADKKRQEHDEREEQAEDHHGALVIVNPHILLGHHQDAVDKQAQVHDAPPVICTNASSSVGLEVAIERIVRLSASAMETSCFTARSAFSEYTRHLSPQGSARE